MTQLINLLGVLGGRRTQNDDVSAWEQAEEGYPYGVVRLLNSFDAGVLRVSAALFSKGQAEPAQVLVVRPSATGIVQLFTILEEEMALDARTHVALFGDGGDFWQRLFDAVIHRVADLSERAGKTLVILPNGEDASGPDRTIR